MNLEIKNCVPKKNFDDCNTDKFIDILKVCKPLKKEKW